MQACARSIVARRFGRMLVTAGFMMNATLVSGVPSNPNEKKALHHEEHEEREEYGQN